MKSSKIIAVLLFGFFGLIANAQTTYKDVKLDRDSYDNTCFVLTNYNKYPVNVSIQYKVGSREAAWNDYSWEYINVAANGSKKISVGSKIYALKLTYVDILQPSFGEKMEKLIDEVAPLRDDIKEIHNSK